MSASTLDSDPILIVGGGPSGLVMAAELARRGVPCRIVDIARGATDKSKAIGIQARTLEVFENMGIAHEFTARGKKVAAVNFSHDDRRLAHVTLNEMDSPFPYVLMLPQSETERILIAHLESLGKRVEREVKLTGFTQTGNGVTAMLSHQDGRQEEARTPWIIGCDGAHSTVRHVLDLPFRGEEYAEGFQLADVRVDWPLKDDELHVYIHDGWLLAAFPLPEGRHRLIADVPPEQAPTDVSPSLEEWQTLMDGRCPVHATLSDPLWTANYRIHRRLVSKLREGRAFLVSDAAHIHSPVGAQGMNTGIQDAFNLAWKLALVTQGVADETLLDTYHAERYLVEQGVLIGTDLPLKVIGLHNPLAQAVRDKLLSLLAGLGVVQERARAAVTGLAVHYPVGAAVEEHPLHGGPQAGSRAPDGAVHGEDGKETRLFEILSGPEHKLLLFAGAEGAGNGNHGLSALVPVVRERLGERVKVHHFSDGVPRGGAGDETAEWRDGEGSLHQRYGAQHGGVYLIRPDGYIGFRSPLAGAAERLRGYLNRVFQSAG